MNYLEFVENTKDSIYVGAYPKHVVQEYSM